MAGPAPERVESLEKHRVDLTRHCYRMLGSVFEAEDAVQETFLRAWKSFDSFQNRAPLRAWLYQIATNVCLDIVKGRQGLPHPVDPGSAETHTAAPSDRDPADVAEVRDSVRLALMAALQHLPPRQRAVLILREVLCWRAGEVAELLGMTVVAVNSTLQRARTALSDMQLMPEGAGSPMDDSQKALLAGFVDAFESYDIGALVSLLPRTDRLVPTECAV